MSETIRLELARDVALDELRAALAQRGLVVRRLDEDGVCTLEVAYERKEAERLASDVVAALEEWVSACRLPLVPTPLDERVYALRPPGD